MLIEGIVSFSCVYPIQGNTIHKEDNKKIPIENLLPIENSYNISNRNVNNKNIKENKKQR